MDKDDISSLIRHIEGHLGFLREALDADNGVGVTEQANEIEGWARSIMEAASGGSGPRPKTRTENQVGFSKVSTGSGRMLTPAQLKALREANVGARGWYPVGGPQHRVARKLADIGLYSIGTGRPTERGRAYLARFARSSVRA